MFPEAMIGPSVYIPSNPISVPFKERVLRKMNTLNSTNCRGNKSNRKGRGRFSSLLLAYKVQKKAARLGFDWKESRDVVAKIEEELKELKVELRKGKKARIKEEMGDFLFSAVNLARKLNIDPEITLHDAIRKFKKRFLIVEQQVRASGKEWKLHRLQDLERYWKKAKKHGSIRQSHG